MAIVAICPYFLGERGGFTYCESCRFNFKDETMRKNYITRFCASFGYKDCPICKQNDEFYERKDYNIEYGKEENEEII